MWTKTALFPAGSCPPSIGSFWKREFATTGGVVRNDLSEDWRDELYNMQGGILVTRPSWTTMVAITRIEEGEGSQRTCQ